MLRAVMLAGVAAYMAATASAMPSTSFERELEVNTTSGKFLGHYVGNTAIWGNMPYATVANRFERSSLAPYDSVLRNATEFGNACPQPAFNFIVQNVSYSLDKVGETGCLNGVAYAPRFRRNGKKLATMIVFPQDTPSTNANSLPDYSDFVARQNMCVFVGNFRTGILGTFYLPGLEHLANNFFYDQQRFIEWVDANAGEFGCDSEKVTWVCPHSRGGADCIEHLANNSGTVQPQHVILMAPTSYRHFSASEQSVLVSQFAAAAPRFCNQTDSADVLACLQGLSESDLLDVSGLPPTFSAPRATIVPNTPFAQQPYQLVSSGAYNKNVRFMIGTNSDIGVGYSLGIGDVLFGQYFPFAQRPPQVTAQFNFVYFTLRVGYGPISANITNFYLAYAQQNGLDGGTSTALAVQHSGYECASNFYIQTMASQGVKVYAYFNNHTMDNPLNNYVEIKGAQYGQGDQMFLLSDGQGNFRWDSGFSSREDELFEFLSDRIATFAKKGKPKQGWKRFKDGDEVYQVNLGLLEGPQSDTLRNIDSFCTFWNDRIPEDVPPAF